MIQREVLKNLISNIKLKGIEIGTLQGDTVAYLLENIPHLEMIAIDILPQRIALAERIAKFNDRIKIIELNSDDAFRALSDTYDFIWIDGNHTYEQVKKDIQNYWPLVRKGGFIGGHDYGTNSFPDVQKAVTEIFRDKINLGDDLTWWVFKDV